MLDQGFSPNYDRIAWTSTS